MQPAALAAAGSVRSLTGGRSLTAEGVGVAASAVPLSGGGAVVALACGDADGSSVARKTPRPMIPATSRTDSIPASMGRSTAASVAAPLRQRGGRGPSGTMSRPVGVKLSSSSSCQK